MPAPARQLVELPNVSIESFISLFLVEFIISIVLKLISIYAIIPRLHFILFGLVMLHGQPQYVDRVVLYQNMTCIFTMLGRNFQKQLTCDSCYGPMDPNTVCCLARTEVTHFIPILTVIVGRIIKKMRKKMRSRNKYMPTKIVVMILLDTIVMPNEGIMS